MKNKTLFHGIEHLLGITITSRTIFGAAFLAALLALAPASPLQAAMHTQTVTYTQGGTTFVGYLAYDDSTQNPRSAVLVVPDWWGVNDTIRTRTEQAAALGAVAFAPDLYGNGRTAKDLSEAQGLADGLIKGDRKTLADRVNAGLQQLQHYPLTDKGKIAAIGFGLGGTAVLDLARSGAPINGVVSFSGTLNTPAPAGTGAVKARVLAIDGTEDPYVTKTQIAAFMDEMDNARADWQIILYGGAAHSFWDPTAGANLSSGTAYDEQADKRSWDEMKFFFTQIFK